MKPGENFSRTSQEILEQLVALEREKALGVELDAFDRKPLVSHAHDLALVGPGDDFQVLRQCTRLNHQAVIAGGFERVGQPAIDAAAVVMNPRGLAMHDSVGPDDVRAEAVPDALVAQADAQQGILGPNRATTSLEIPASRGVQGPGEMISRLGPAASISSSVT